jgi:hypothetical protein
MPDANAVMSREQHAAVEFTNAMFHLRSEFERREDQHAVTAMIEAALRFGDCELRMRRSERLNALGLHRTEASELAKSAMVNNELGLTALPGVRPLIERLSSEETDRKAASLWRKALASMRQEWRHQIADLDLDAAKARQIMRMVEEVCEAANRDGLAGLGQHLSDRLIELQKVRRTKNRGTQAESFPYWKIAVAAVYWGFTVAATYILITQGAPWWQPFLVWVIAAIVTFCVALGC